MHGDFSRVTFRPGKHYSAVLVQQGRVQLDADANEQAAIELHRLRTLAADLVGRHGGPAADAGFRIEYRPRSHEVDDLVIGGGRYYVDGILCDASRPAPGTAAPADGVGRNDPAPGDATEATWTYWDQPDAYRDPELAADRLPDTFPYLVYLKVWERAVGAVEDPDLREVALGAAMPDTAARARLIWQVLALPGGELDAPDGGAGTIRTAFGAWADQHTAPAGLLAARSQRPDGADDDACLVRPDARYRGPENQLYRVEIHHGATAAEGATFKWSRENGSVVFPVAGFTTAWAELATLGDDPKLSLDVGDRVEVCDSAYLNRGEPAPLLRVEEVDLPGRRVRLSDQPVPGVGRVAGRHPFLRRWDHTTPSGAGAPGLAGGALRLAEGAWLDLEDGVQIYFRPGAVYRTGDHWIIPARTVTGTVEWPVDTAGDPLLREPAGVHAHYAPLAWVTGPQSPLDLRFVFSPLAAAVPDPGEN